jgi:hypothetical protein
MDPFHEQLARVALDAAGSFGFALAGGYAVQAHGFLNRMSSDVDLFAEASGKFDFSEAVSAVISAYQREGLAVQAEVQTTSFARLEVGPHQTARRTVRQGRGTRLRRCGRDRGQRPVHGG